MKWAMTSVLSMFLGFSFLASAKEQEAKKKNVQYRKTQEVNFEGADIDGQLRSPDGAYILQKRGVQFLPLYKINDQIDLNIQEAVEYLR